MCIDLAPTWTRPTLLKITFHTSGVRRVNQLPQPPNFEQLGMDVPINRICSNTYTHRHTLIQTCTYTITQTLSHTRTQNVGPTLVHTQTHTLHMHVSTHMTHINIQRPLHIYTNKQSHTRAGAYTHTHTHTTRTRTRTTTTTTTTTRTTHTRTRSQKSNYSPFLVQETKPPTKTTKTDIHINKRLTNHWSYC